MKAQRESRYTAVLFLWPRRYMLVGDQCGLSAAYLREIEAAPFEQEAG